MPWKNNIVADAARQEAAAAKDDMGGRDSGSRQHDTWFLVGLQNTGMASNIVKDYKLLLTKTSRHRLGLFH